MRLDVKKPRLHRAALAVICALAALAALGAVRWTIPSAWVEAKLRQSLAASTGYAVESVGETKVSAFPWPTIHLADLALSRTGEQGERIEASLVKARLNAVSWLVGEPRLVELAFFDPRIDLASREGEAGAGQADAAAISTAIVDLLGRDRRRDLRTLRIERGELRLNGQPWMTDLRLHLSGVAGADLRLAAAGRHGGVPIRVEAEVAPVRAEERRPLRWTIAASTFNASFAGDLFGPRSLDAEGRLSIAIVDGSAFARRLNLSASHAPLLDGLTANGRARFSWPSVQIREAVIARGATRLDGSIEMSFGRPKSAIAATLDAQRFDLTPLLQPLAGALADREGRWSDQPFATDWLSAASLDLRLSAGRLVAGPAAIEGAALSLQLGGGRMDMILSGGQPRTGTVKGRLTLSGLSDASLDVRAQGSVERLDLSQLGAAAGLPRLRGSGGGQVALRGAGASLADLVAATTGRAEATFRDGEFHGIDMERLGLRPESAASGGTPERRTRFTSLTLQMRVAEGRADVTDSAILTPLVRAPIDGSIGLAGRTFDLTLRPAPALPGSRIGESRYRLEGPWSNPSLALDTTGGIDRR